MKISKADLELMRPERSPVGALTVKVGQSGVDMFIKELTEKGETFHSGIGATLWAATAVCRELGYPYRVLKLTDRDGGVMGFSVARKNMSIPAPDLTVGSKIEVIEEWQAPEPGRKAKP